MAGFDESEIKYLLSGREDLERLLGPSGLEGRVGTERQENLYFDTPERLFSRNRAMLRLRKMAGGALLTLKTGGELADGHFQAREVEAPLEVSVAEAISRSPEKMYSLELDPVRALLDRFGRVPLVQAGRLVNERTSFQTGGYRVEVDHMVFPDGSEAYEVEVETDRPEAARSWLEAELRRRGVKAGPSRLTKFARLLQKQGQLPLLPPGGSVE